MMAKFTTFGIVLLVFVGEILARRQSPLLEEGGRGRNRNAECQFGKQLRELGSTWFADLGPPFGVMYCIKCQCVPFQRKRRIVARVQCKNIKNDCPEPTCDEPVLLPGQCCKTCPEKASDWPSMRGDVESVMTPEEEERNMKHFAAILTGRTSLVLHRDDAVMPGASPARRQEGVVATGRFTFHRKHLYFSFYTSAATRPKALQFVDQAGNILLETNLSADSAYAAATGKVCGIWHRVPREYRRLLRDEKVYATLVWANDEPPLSGPVASYRGLPTELFTALLAPNASADNNAMLGAGGTAIVTASSTTPSIHVELVFNGVFSPKEVSDVALVVRLETANGTVILEEVVKVSKPAFEINVAEFKSAVSASDLRLLTRGRLRLSIENRNSPEVFRLEGRVQTRATCEIFQSLVSASDADSEDGDLTSAGTTASGVGLFYVNKDGALIYDVQMDSLPAEPAPMLTLVSGRGRRRVELEDLTPSLRLANGTARGQIDRLSPKELEQLYDGELAVNVATETAPSLVRGKLASRLVADARVSANPSLLRRRDSTSVARMTGLAWVAVDLECTLHYEVFLSGLPEDKPALALYLEEIPFIAPGAPVSRRFLQDFTGNQLEGFEDSLNGMELASVESSVNYLEVRDNVTGNVLLRTRVLKVPVPLSCLPLARNDIDLPGVEGNDPESNAVTACFHEGRFRDDGTQWKSALDTCAMCSCRRREVKCETMTCPKLTCLKQVPVSGECCPVCDIGATNTTQGCHMAGEFHAPGSSWHPYVPPLGFDLCALCTCSGLPAVTACSKVACPVLACPSHLSMRAEKGACCRQCPPVPETVPVERGIANEQPQARTRAEVLASGGCGSGGLFENGVEWHPRVIPFGENKCVTCRCKDGKIGCEKKHCSKSCAKESWSKEKDECCPPCKRRNRHHKTSNFS